MAGAAKSPSAKRSLKRSSTAQPQPICVLSRSSSTCFATPKAGRRRPLLRSPLRLRTRKSSSSSRSGCGTRSEKKLMIDELTRAEYDAVLRSDFATFAARCFHDLNPQADLAMGWHIEVIAAKLAAVLQGKIRRLIINLPPRHLKSHLASIAFP